MERDECKQEPSNLSSPIPNNRKVSVTDDYGHLFIELATKPSHYDIRDAFVIFCKAIFLPIILAAPVILIPLEGLHSNKAVTDDDEVSPINPWCYVCFQIAYSSLAYNCMVRLFSNPLRNALHWTVIWIVLPFVGEFAIFWIYYLSVCLYPKEALASNGLPGQLPGFGVDILFICIWIGFAIGSALTYSQLQRENVNRPEIIAESSNPIARQISIIQHSISSDFNSTMTGGGTMLSMATLNRLQSEATATTTNELTLFGNNNPAQGRRSSIDEPQSDPANLSINASVGVTIEVQKELEERKDMVMIDYISMYGRVTLMSLTILGLYLWCIWFTSFFEANQASPYSSVFVFGFLVVTGLGGTIARMSGSYVDEGMVTGSVSLNVVCGIFGDCFLIIYQRNLFSFVSTWSSFIMLSVLVNFYEIMMYQFQTTDIYSWYHDRILARAVDRSSASSGHSGDCFLQLLAKIFGSIHIWKNGDITVSKNCLNISYRFVLRLSSSIAYIIFTTFLQFGYNSKSYPDSNASGGIAQYKQLIEFIILSLVADILVFAVTDYLLVRKTGYSLSRRFVSFFQIAGQTEYLVFMVWVTAHITTDVFVAKLGSPLS